MIGSGAKWSRFRRNLIEAGHQAGSVEMIQCPIGLAEVSGKEPAVIAVAVAAKLLPAMATATATAMANVSAAVAGP